MCAWSVLGQDGAAIYQKRCASCHDAAASGQQVGQLVGQPGRVPPSSALRVMSPDKILGALEGGYAATFAALGLGGTMGVSFSLVRRIREEMVGTVMKVMTHLTRGEQKAWLQIYSKIYDYCQAKDDPPLRSKSRRDLLMSRRFENGTR